jgi:hypothetical protein
VDVNAVGDTISGLGKREFVLRRAGKDQPEVFTSRWAMSYLRGPLTRDQIKTLMAGASPPPAAEPAPATSTEPVGATEAAGPAAAVATDTTPVMPKSAGGVPVRWVDRAAGWLADVGGDPMGTVSEAALVARVSLRYDETKADLVHDQEYEAVLFPLADHVDVSRAVAVDYDDRDLREAAPDGWTYRLSGAPLDQSSFFKQVERDLVDHLTRSLTMEIPVNQDLKLYGRPGEDDEAFATRCAQVAGERADAETAKLRDKYEKKATTLRDRIEAATDAAEVASDQQKARERDSLLSSAGSILGGLLGGRSRGGLLGQIGRAAGRSTRATAGASRVDAAQNKVTRLQDELEAVEAELAEEITEIDDRWMGLAKNISKLSIGLERTDVKVTQLSLAWTPVS